METGHARIPGEALREYASTNGGVYRGPGRPYEMLSECYQYYLVNKLTLTQGVQIFFSKVVAWGYNRIVLENARLGTSSKQFVR